MHLNLTRCKKQTMLHNSSTSLYICAVGLATKSAFHHNSSYDEMQFSMLACCISYIKTWWTLNPLLMQCNKCPSLFTTLVFCENHTLLLSADWGCHKHQHEDREAVTAFRIQVRSQGEGSGQHWSVEPLESCGDVADWRRWVKKTFSVISNPGAICC